MPHHIPKPVRLTFYFGIAFVFLLLALHHTLNNKNIQQVVLDAAARYFGVQITWDKMKFNGATGKFSGDNFFLDIPKTETTVSLKRFSVAISPLKLLFKKIELIDIQADELSVKAGRLKPPAEKKKKGNLVRLLERVHAERADINKVDLELPGDKKVSIHKIQVRRKLKLFFYHHSHEFSLENLTLLSPKFDLFAQKIAAAGSFDVVYNFNSKKLEPFFDGTVLLNDILAGFNKLPIPWNPALAWDETLTPTLQQKYPGGIPDNRSFAHVNKADLSLVVGPSSYEIKKGEITAFEGVIKVAGVWQMSDGRTVLKISTPHPPKLSLLPLGKSNFRRSFERFGIDLKASGKFFNAKKGDLKGELKVALLGNKNYPQPADLRLTVKPVFKNGLLSIPDLAVVLGDGKLNAKGEINLPGNSMKVNVDGKALDAKTVIRFFSTIEIPAIADVKGQITGGLKNPLFDLTVSSDKAGYEGLDLGKTAGTLKIRDQNLSLDLKSLLEGQGEGNVNLDIIEVFRSSRQKTTLKTSFRNLPAGALLNTKVATGTVNGFFNMTKEKQSYDGIGEITASDIHWYKIPIQKISGRLKLEGKTLSVAPIQVVWNPSEPAVSTSKPLAFTFAPEGWEMEGQLLPMVAAQGGVAKSNPDFLRLTLDAKNTPLPFLKTLIPLEMQKASLTGLFDIEYHFSNPAMTKVTADLTEFEFLGEEKSVRLAGRSHLVYEAGKVNFNQVLWTLGRGKLTLDGPLASTDGSNLKIRGQLDLDQLTGLQQWMAEGSGLAAVDLLWQGSMAKPSFRGKIRFTGAGLLFRNLRGELSETNGELSLDGKRFVLTGFRTRYDDAPMVLNGWMEWNESFDKMVAANLKLNGEEIPLSYPDTWRMLTDADLLLHGAGEALTLSGRLQIVEGLYYKDYSLSQFVLKPVGVLRERKPAAPLFFENIRLDLNVKSSGEFEVKNNLAELAMRGDLKVSGSLSSPVINGGINVVEGRIHAFGIDFEDATGFASFTTADVIDPYIEFVASHEIQNYEVRARLKGRTSNLALVLESTPALAQNDVLSLIAYGQTPDQLSRANQNIFSQAALASQLVGLLQRPLSKATHLDIVKLEQDYTRKELAPTRFSIGKRVSERFSFAFTTDLALDDASKGFTGEYQILDNLLLKGTKDTGSRYRFDLTWRFQGY